MTFTEFMIQQTQLSEAGLLTYDDLLEWPVDPVEQAKQQGCLVQCDDAEGVTCRQCPEHCWKEVEIRRKDGRNVGVFFCENEDCAGLMTAELIRLQQWKIDKKKLWKQVYGYDSEWQVPWDDKNPEYFSLKEIVNLASIDSITIRTMRRQLEDPEFPVHHMHKGKRCRVHISDFRKWLQYAQPCWRSG